MSNNFWMHNRKFLVNSRNELTQIWIFFFYWTGANERYRDFDLPSFNEPSGEGIIERLDRISLSRRGDPGVFVANRAFLSQRGQLTVRARFHRTSVELLPPQLEGQ